MWDLENWRTGDLDIQSFFQGKDETDLRSPKHLYPKCVMQFKLQLQFIREAEMGI